MKNSLLPHTTDTSAKNYDRKKSTFFSKEKCFNCQVLELAALRAPSTKAALLLCEFAANLRLK